MKKYLLAVAVLNFIGIGAFANSQYQLAITNTSDMPISAGVVYVLAGARGASEIGDLPTEGLVDLCQKGDPSKKFEELKTDARVTWEMKTPGPILPGKSINVTVRVAHTATQSIHFEGMYGKSKEVCSSISVDSTALSNLKKGEELLRTDTVIVAGAFTAPVVPADKTVCQSASSAVDCLRLLANPLSDKKPTHYFSGYLPSVLEFLEGQYGAIDTQTLLIPTSGAIRYSLISK